MAKQSKIHYLHQERYRGFWRHSRSGWACDSYYRHNGTKDVERITCNRCKKTKAYKRAVDKKWKQKYPLFKGIEFQYIGGK